MRKPASPKPTSRAREPGPFRSNGPAELRQRKTLSLFSLSAVVRNGIALIVVAGVSAAGWLVGRDRPVPEWIESRLLPVLAWAVLALAAVALVDWVRRRRGNRRGASAARKD